ncbi:unnamed protein product [Oppiella nova]|uniref:Sulfotransferase domain-containing protein n=1 Tax=Oppiella nova TaxID=334625 RepID=A0A7R9QH55_9ACAR|nr:unnamed protein product [Oppiella nova]CAG2165259.1 unnamed protein product [Oppiella nova]
MQWCLNSPNCTDVDVLCQRMRTDINAVLQIKKWSNVNITFVRYEDIALKPYETAKRLYNNLDLEYTPAVQMWVKEHTRKEDILGNPHSTRRDSQRAPLSWIPRMTVNDVLEVQEYCYDVMQNLGYKLINDLVYDDNDTQALNNYTLDQILDTKYPLLDLMS